MLDIFTLSVLFLTDCETKSASPVISLATKSINPDGLISSLDDSEPKNMNNLESEVVFCWSKNGYIVLLDSTTGGVLSSMSTHLEQLNGVSIHFLGEYSLDSTCQGLFLLQLYNNCLCRGHRFFPRRLQ